LSAFEQIDDNRDWYSPSHWQCWRTFNRPPQILGQEMVPRAMAQISVSVIVTAVLCPFIVAFIANSQATAKSRPALIEQGVSE